MELLLYIVYGYIIRELPNVSRPAARNKQNGYGGSASLYEPFHKELCRC